MPTVEEVISILDNAASRGFLSKEVPYTWSINKEKPIMHQVVKFTDMEKQIIRQFMSDNIAILRSVDYPIFDMYESNRRTISLLGMLSHMIHGNDCGPEYVADNAKRLSDIQERFNTFSPSQLKSLLGE